MGLLPLLTRDQVAPELQPLRDELERVSPQFRHLWATQAHSPAIFRHIWGELIEMKPETTAMASSKCRAATGLDCFNWHNDFLELDVEPGVPGRGGHAAAGLAAAGPATRG